MMLGKSSCAYLALVLLLVGIQAATSVPHYAAQPSIYPSSAPAGGLGYQSAASSSYAGSGAGGASPFAANPYNVGFAGAASQQDLFQQYFAALRAQHEAFQRQLQAQILSQQQAIWDQSNRLDSNFGNSGDSNGEPVSAFGAVSLGPQGGYQAAQISPAAPGIFSRFGESVPPPSGNVYGVFSSSSSSSQTGPDGKTVSRKTSTVGVNDNGKISVKTVHDP